MNILELKVNFAPEIAAGVVLDYETAVDLARAGHCVFVHTPMPSSRN